MLKILISAFACGPNEGSEMGVGWDWSLHIASRHQVWALVCSIHEEAIERWRAEHPDCPVRFVYVPLEIPYGRTNGIRWQFLYYAWQWRAYQTARQLHAQIRFDLVHHLTYASFRIPSFLPLLDCPFVWGPIGGGEEATLPFYHPRELGWNDSLRQHLRLVSNRLVPCGPVVRRTLERAAAILVQTTQTRDRLPKRFHAKTLLYMDNRIDLPECLLGEPPAPPEGELRVVMGARMLAWKGGHLLLRALAEARGRLKPDQRMTLSFIGRGAFEGRLRALTAALGLQSMVRFEGALPLEEYRRSLRNFHLFALPSFSDSASLATVEALAAGLPVLTLGFGGPGEFVDAQIGFRVAARTPAEAVHGLAAALHEALTHPDTWKRRSEAGRRVARLHCDWNRTLDFLDGVYSQAVAGRPPLVSLPAGLAE